MTILLANEKATVVQALSAILTHEGYKVITVNSSVLSLEAAAIPRFDMVIADFRKPDSDGFVFARRLAKINLALPVLLISKSNQGAVPMAEIAERNWCHMAEPIDPERILRIDDGNVSAGLYGYKPTPPAVRASCTAHPVVRIRHPGSVQIVDRNCSRGTYFSCHLRRDSEPDSI